jgi:pimeloyl-ACP methyl ester carboxylesterase
MQVYNDLTTIPLITNLFGSSLQDEVATELLCRYNGRDPLADCTKQLQFQKPPYCGIFFVVESEPRAFRPPTGDLKDNTFPISAGEDLRRCAEMTGHFASYLVTFPAKLGIGPILDTFGTSAWDSMQRRIHLLFRKEEEMDDRNGDSEIIQLARKDQSLATIEASGGFSMFLRALKQHMKGQQWELVLVGHSMGSIVINELLRAFGDEQLPITHIVYLAGAASVRDYEDSVWPFLKTHPQTQFHNFTLHPIEERSEIQYGMLDLPPRGTLLEWLDHFLADPITLMDRTVGRYDNFLKAVHDTPSELRHRIHFRSFNAGRDVEKVNPQTHHDAGERFRYWESTCWGVDASLEQCVKMK